MELHSPNEIKVPSASTKREAIVVKIISSAITLRCQSASSKHALLITKSVLVIKKSSLSVLDLNFLNRLSWD